jgi:poly(3-hydroxyalkanoate) synthetase
VAPQALAEIQADFSREWSNLCAQARQGVLAPPTDRRFLAPAWISNSLNLMLAHAYLLSVRAMSRMVDAAHVSEPVRNRLRFSVMQWLEALSPANFLALNPDALQSAVESAGQALNQGMVNFLADLKKGQITQTDETPFELGGNIAATPGAVVFENHLFQLIQYAPQTSKVYKRPQVNALGFCVGGTMLASALALAQARGPSPVHSLTLLTSLLDFQDSGVLDVFVDESHALMRDHQLGGGGVMSGRDLATTFSFLRPNKFVWNYVVNNYLKGQTPPAFDLLFWNGDSTNLPGPFFSWYFRNTYLENNLKVPGRVQISGVSLDLTRLEMPAYIFGSREDHIVPWTSAYASTQLLRGPKRFVLGASGHIAGVVNPPSKKRRSHWIGKSDGTVMPGDPNMWLKDATEQPGSWWPDWKQWLAVHAGKSIKAKTTLGNALYAPIEPAPGRYVKVRVS